MDKVSKASCSEMYNAAKPYLGVILLQFGYAGMPIIAESAIKQGMNIYTYTVYRNAIAALIFAPFAIFLERKIRPAMTASIFWKILLLGLLEPVLDQNLYYTGMKYTSATFTSAMCNILPALTFVMAWILRLEKVNIKRLHSQGKVLGTLVTVGGAMIMTLVTGPTIGLPWSQHDQPAAADATDPQQDSIKGALMITAGCLCWACFVILQAITLKSYPAELSLTALICMMGTIQGIILTIVVEKENTAIWAIHWDTKFQAALYGGIVCAGAGYYISGVVMRQRGPVFVTAFGPLSMVIVAILGPFMLSEQLVLGRVIGAIVIVIGLYLVLWGKSKDQCSSKYDNELLPIDQVKSHTNIDAKIPVHDQITSKVAATSEATGVIEMYLNQASSAIALRPVYKAWCIQKFGYAGMPIVTKAAINQGMNIYTYTVYRNAIAALIFTPFAVFLERKARPGMTASIFWKIVLLGLLDATFTSAMCNILPAITFVMAWILRLEKVNIKSFHNQVKVLGTLVTVGGAMIMTMVTGPSIGLPWSKHDQAAAKADGAATYPQQDSVKGALMITAGCLCWAFENENLAIWAIHWDTKFKAALYGGIFCAGLGYYISGLVMRQRGPVFVTSFDPLSMVIVAILGPFMLFEQLFYGRAFGAITIVIGLYLVLWGKSKDQPSSKSDDELQAINQEKPNTNVDAKIPVRNHDHV
ncbi:hypothetical protein ACET3Z_029134 [Daucus carota]